MRKNEGRMMKTAMLNGLFNMAGGLLGSVNAETKLKDFFVGKKSVTEIISRLIQNPKAVFKEMADHAFRAGAQEEWVLNFLISAHLSVPQMA